jgi:hypothetical protein
MKNKPVLFLVIDSNGTVYQEVDCEINYIKELESCVKYLSNYKDSFDIVCCNIGNSLPQTTQIILKECDVKLLNIVLHDKIHRCSWYNIVLVGEMLEHIYNDRVLLHIDLDMLLMKEIPNDLININPTEVKVARYFDNGRDSNIACTCFIVSYGGSKFYSYWSRYLLENSKEIQEDKAFCEFEEKSIDLMISEQPFSNTNFTINYINKEFMLGNAYAHEFSDDIIFIHCHENQNRAKYMEIYLNGTITNTAN